MNEITTFIPESPGRISMKGLSMLTGYDERKVRSLVLAARISGELIGSDTRGYFIPSSVEELEAFYRAARKRALSTLSSLKAVRLKIKAAAVEGGRDGKS